MMLLYATEDEEEAIPLLDTLAADPLVASCYSYPGLALKQYTAPELVAQFADMTPLEAMEFLKDRVAKTINNEEFLMSLDK